jgi:TonB family protein
MNFPIRKIIIFLLGGLIGSGKTHASESTIQAQQPFWSIPEHLREVLAQPGNPSVDTLERLLKDEDARVRIVVAQALGRTGVQAIPPLIRILHDQDPFVRWTAILSLSQIGMPAVQALIDETRSSEGSRRSDAASTLLIVANGFLPDNYKVSLNAEVRQQVEESVRFMLCGKPPCIRNLAVPVYPQLGLHAGLSGRVKVDLQIDRGGSVGAAKSEGPEVLAIAAEQALRRWTFDRFPPDAAFPYPFTVNVDFAVMGDYRDPGVATAVDLRLPTSIRVFARRPRIEIDSHN